MTLRDAPRCPATLALLALVLLLALPGPALGATTWLDVSPQLSTAYGRNAALRDIEKFTNHTIWNTAWHAPDELNLLACQLSLRMTFPFGRATLINHILRVLSLGSKIQVIGSNAGWIIAMVQYAHSIWDRSIFNLPAKPAAQLYDLSTQPNLSVASRVFASNPNPATIRFVDLLPETVNQGESTWSCFELNVSCQHA